MVQHDSVILGDLPELAEASLGWVMALRDTATARMRRDAGGAGKISPSWLAQHQFAVHGLAWLATTHEALRQMSFWAQDLDAQGNLGETERLLLQIAFGEYLAQVHGGIPMNQGETIRPADLGLDTADHGLAPNAAARCLIEAGNTAAARAAFIQLLREGDSITTVRASRLDEPLAMVRDQFRRYTIDKVEPFAHRWHLNDTLIPRGTITELAELGVFGLTIAEEYGGAGFGKMAMCVVSEELSRGYIGVGSLATRAEIAAELIATSGTNEQKRRWLPEIANGTVMPAAVFTEPDTGSNLGALTTRAIRNSDGSYQVMGSKSWITHAARANMMTLLARTDPDTRDHQGLSMFLARKSPATDDDLFPDPGLSGTEIPVLGYRGMKEYELSFEGFQMPATSLLGAREGQGFRQLMATFESARIQTAARALGVAQSAFDQALTYARERRQFGQHLLAFPRISGKLAMMAAEIMAARQLTWFAAKQKDEGNRCDLEAGMAKLLAGRVAWAAADNAVQIHGGNGFALEYEVSRILCDARILNIFEGASEIQAQVIARRLLAG